MKQITKKLTIAIVAMLSVGSQQIQSSVWQATAAITLINGAITTGGYYLGRNMVEELKDAAKGVHQGMTEVRQEFASAATTFNKNAERAESLMSAGIRPMASFAERINGSPVVGEMLNPNSSSTWSKAKHYYVEIGVILGMAQMAWNIYKLSSQMVASEPAQSPQQKALARQGLGYR